MPKKRTSVKITGPKWLVRAPNGDLYVISANNPPVKLVGAAKNKATKIIKTAQRDLSREISETTPSLASGVWLSITETFGQY